LRNDQAVERVTMVPFELPEGKQVGGPNRKQLKPLFANFVEEVLNRRPKAWKSTLRDFDRDLPKGNKAHDDLSLSVPDCVPGDDGESLWLRN
jgi:hypothetical protein